LTIITKVEGLKCIEVNMNKIVVKILQGSVVTQTVLGGLTMHRSAANYLWRIFA